MTGATGKSIAVTGPVLLQSGSSMNQDQLGALHAENVVEAREVLSGWGGTMATGIVAGIIINVDETGIRSSRLSLTGKMGIGPRVSMKTLFGVEDQQLRMQLSLTKCASIFEFPSDGVETAVI